MEADAEFPSPSAPWLPLTPGRAARLAAFHPGRLAVLTLLAAATIAGAVLRLADVGWFPAVEEAIAQVPAGAALDGGMLVWPENHRRVLADNMYLSIAVGPVADAPGVQAADLHFEFTAEALWVTWMAGHLRLGYPAGYVIDLDRKTLEPLWQAWRPHLHAGVFLATMLLAVLAWGLMALVLAPFVTLLAGLIRRCCGLGVAWRLSLAAFLPGSVLLAAAIFLYGFRYLNVPMALAAMGLQVVVALLLLGSAPWYLRRRLSKAPSVGRTPAEAPSDNPFAVPDPMAEEEDDDELQAGSSRDTQSPE